MPVTPTYPGVYIEEIPSGVHAITGVSTSTTLFIGWTRKGPVDHAQRVLSWQDFERHFGGLDRESLMSYAVSHFFTNGGQDAYVMRLVAVAADGKEAKAAFVDLPIGGDKLTLTATNPGAWANKYGIVIKHRPDDPTRFRLAVVLVDTSTVVESFENLSMNPTDRRYVKTVIDAESAIIGATVTGNPMNPPADTASPQALTQGDDGTVLHPNTNEFQSKIDPALPVLDRIDLFNLLCVAGETDAATLAKLEKYCRDRRAFLIADCAESATLASLQSGAPGDLTKADGINAAFYFPWLTAPDPLQENRLTTFPPSGFAAGIYARTDAARGIWKAPAGIDASVGGASGVKIVLTDKENGTLNPLAVNCIRTFPVYGTVLWGARTLNGQDERASEWKYIPVRRTALFIEESLYRGTKWVVFEPNDEPLWAQIRLNVGAFMHNLFRQGAFQGQTPREAYLVKCDKETTTQNDINLGIVNIVVGFAPLKPAEFVIIKIQQLAGQIQA